MYINRIIFAFEELEGPLAMQTASASDTPECGSARPAMFDNYWIARSILH